MLQEVTLLAWMAFGRSQAGEYLHAQQHLGSAVDVLLQLLRRHGVAEGFQRINEPSPRRRLHAFAPSLARELLGILLGAVDAPEARLLDIAERNLRAVTPELHWENLLEVRSRMRRGTSLETRSPQL
jgi:hypothetical protein